MAKGLQHIGSMYARRAAQERRRSEVTNSATFKEIDGNQFLSDEEKAQFREEMLAQNALNPVTDLPRATSLFGDLRGGSNPIGKSDVATRMADLIRPRQIQAQLTNLRNQLTQESGFAGIEQRRRTAATQSARQLSPGQDSASRKGTTLITSRA